MITLDVQNVMQKPYGVDVSPTLVSEIADLAAEVIAWRRRLDPVGPMV
jgi:hypothetical protein